MGNRFGIFHNYFNSFFQNLDNLEENSAARNLLYVACSRAIKKLRVLYIDSVEGFSENIEKIFGQIKTDLYIE